MIFANESLFKFQMMIFSGTKNSQKNLKNSSPISIKMIKVFNINE